MAKRQQECCSKDICFQIRNIYHTKTHINLLCLKGPITVGDCKEVRGVVFITVEGRHDSRGMSWYVEGVVTVVYWVGGCHDSLRVSWMFEGVITVGGCHADMENVFIFLHEQIFSIKSLPGSAYIVQKPKMQQNSGKKSRIRETKNLSACAVSSTSRVNREYWRKKILNWKKSLKMRKLKNV